MKRLTTTIATLLLALLCTLPARAALLITAQTVNSPDAVNPAAQGWAVGEKFYFSGSTPVASLARWMFAGNNKTHTLYLIADSDKSVVASVSLNLSGKTAGQWAWADLPSPVTVPAGFYYLLSSETPTGTSADDVFCLTATSVTYGPICGGDGQNGFAESITTDASKFHAYTSGMSQGPVNLSTVAMAVLNASVTRGSIDNAANRATCTASGGTSPFTYQWHRSTVAGFTPSSSTAITGATSATLTDTTAVLGQIYTYKCVVTDSASATATTADLGMSRQTLAGVILIAGGNSIYNSNSTGDGVTTVDRIAENLRAILGDRNVVEVNAAVSGTTAGGWVLDPSYSNNLNTAANAAIAANPTYTPIVIWHLGENDAWQGASAPTWIGNMNTLTGRVRTGLTKSAVQIVNGPGYRTDLNYPACANLCLDDNAALDGVRATDVMVGDRGQWACWMVNNPAHTDLCHPTDALAGRALADIHTMPILQALGITGLDAATMYQVQTQFNSNSTSLAAIKTQTDKIGTNSADSPNMQTTQGRVDTTLSGIVASVWANPTRTMTAINDSAGVTTLMSRIGSALTISGGKVAAVIGSGDNSDKTGYSLTTAYDAAKTASSNSAVAAVQTAIDSLAAISGTGNTRVDHNTGGADNLAAKTSGGAGISGVTIRAYVTAEYSSGVFTVRGETTTNDSGEWVRPMYLNAGTPYTLAFEKSGYSFPTRTVTP